MDALCILQDDATDKAIQINAMGSIYKNATVTIAAANATDVIQGFLSVRTSPTTRVGKVPLILPDGAYGHVSLTERIEFYSAENPLDSRGWVLQEFLLSPRVLLFGNDEVTWNCQSERFKKIAPNHLNYNKNLNRLPPAVFGVGSGQVMRNPVDRINLWDDIVMDYTRRLLTFPEDRLPALAGIAQELANVWNDVYVAGMWRSSLLQQLGWHRPADSPDPDVGTPNCGPSWSWVSLSCPISRELVQNSDAEVLDCSTDPVHKEAPFGQVKGGELVIRGRLIKASQVDRAIASSWHFFFDLDKYESKRGIYYLFLGWRFRLTVAEAKRNIALMLCRTDPSTFKRVGLIYRCDEDMWLHADRITVRIV